MITQLLNLKSDGIKVSLDLFQASDLYQRWKGRCTGRNKEDSHIQRSDEEKGLERIGRYKKIIGVSSNSVDLWEFI